jgi:hypothetical protein
LILCPSLKTTRRHPEQKGQKDLGGKRDKQGWQNRTRTNRGGREGKTGSIVKREDMQNLQEGKRVIGLGGGREIDSIGKGRAMDKHG